MLGIGAVGLLSRALGPGAPPRGSTDETLASYAEKTVERLRETLTFYRGRQRQDVGELFIAGGGALLPGLAERLCKGAGLPGFPSRSPEGDRGRRTWNGRSRARAVLDSSPHVGCAGGGMAQVYRINLYREYFEKKRQGPGAEHWAPAWPQAWSESRSC